MFKRPTARRKRGNDGITLNLVPILDTMVTLIAFLLFTMAFMAIVGIESPFPQASPKDVEAQLKEKPLQLTLSIHENDAEIWSPFERIEAKKIPNLPEGKPDFKLIHEALITVKQKFPEETKIVIVPHPSVNYDTLIAAMDNMRLLEPTDPPIYRKNEKTGNDESVKTLFPDVIFGNLLGDA